MDRKKLNLGCGIRKLDGYYNIDISSEVKPDLVWDLNEGLPSIISDNSVDHIEVTHTLEHIKEIIYLMNECYRVLKHGGTMHIVVPQGEGIWADPTHVRAFSKLSWRYWDKDYDKAGNLSYGIRTDFKTIKNEFIYNEDGGVLDITLKKL